MKNNTSIQKFLKKALEYCQTNQLEKAKYIYLELIKTLPQHPEILTNLGTIELQMGNFQQGVALLEKSLEINPYQIHATTNLANGYFELEKFSEAIILFNKAISSNASHIDAIYNKGRALSAIGKFDEALSCYTTVIDLMPNHTLALNNRAYINNKFMRYENALSDCNEAIKINSKFIPAYINLAVSQHGIKNYFDALHTLQIAQRFDPMNAEVFFRAGITYSAIKNYKEAIQYFDKAIGLNEDMDGAFVSRGLAYFHLHEYDKALESYDQALKINSKNFDAVNNKGILLYAQNQYDKALELCEEAISINANMPQNYLNRAKIYNAIGKVQLALNDYQKAISLDKHYAEAYYGLSLIYLNQKKFNLGWQYHEKRSEINQYEFEYFYKVKKNFPEQLNFKNKKILIYSEHGLGDQILYLSMMKDLNFIENDITVIVNQKLLELFKRSCVFFKFIPKDLFKQSFSYDYYILSASLGAITRKSINSFENQEKNYLKSNKNLTEKIISKIKKDNNYICGISWKSKNEDFGADKSISLQSLLPILKLPNITFVNLQYGDIKSEIEMLYKNYNIDIKIIEEIDNFNDIDGLASLIDACDFVITTSNVTVHLAGGLGKETYLLVPFAKGRIWYWHDNDTESIWYPSVKIFRQPSINLWSKPIDEIAQIIKVKNNERSN